MDVDEGTTFFCTAHDIKQALLLVEGFIEEKEREDKEEEITIDRLNDWLTGLLDKLSTTCG